MAKVPNLPRNVAESELQAGKVAKGRGAILLRRPLSAALEKVVEVRRLARGSLRLRKRIRLLLRLALRVRLLRLLLLCWLRGGGAEPAKQASACGLRLLGLGAGESRSKEATRCRRSGFRGANVSEETWARLRLRRGGGRAAKQASACLSGG